MQLRTYFTIHTVLFVLIGLFVIIMPTFLADMSGTALTEPEGIQLGRLLGISVLSLAVLTWFTRDMQPSKALMGIVLALAMWHGLDALNMIVGILQEEKSVLAWMFPVTHGLISLGFFAFLPGSKPKV